MITYLINFTLCSALMLLAYQLLLKNKAMYRFNRLYLLGSILFSLGVPLIVVKQPAPQPVIVVNSVPQQAVDAYQIITQIASAPQTAVQAVKFNLADYVGTALLAVYALISAALLYRFVKNLHTIGAMIRRNQTIPYRDARLVLIPQKLTPHTFLDCIFLNNDEYLNHQVDEVILQHELAHARQRHTADVIVIELLQVFCWFNPVLLLYRRAIRLNHEFLADDAVLNANYNVISYQTLLVNKLTDVRSLGITSQFNYSITKKRLMMMTKKTSATAAWISRLALMPVLIIAFMLFCTKTQAVERMVDKVMAKVQALTPDTLKIVPPVKQIRFPPPSFGYYPHTQAGVPQALVDEYKAIEKKYSHSRDKGRYPIYFTKIIGADKDRMVVIYKQMSQAQQMDCMVNFYYAPLPKPLTATTQQMLDKWTTMPQIYGVWVNHKRLKNAELANYKPEDIGVQFVSHLTPIAVKNDHFEFQIDLMTNDFYAQYKKEAIANRYKSEMSYHINIAPPVKEKPQKTSPVKADAAANQAQTFRWVDYRYLAPGFADQRKNIAGC